MKRRHNNPLSIRNKTFEDPWAGILEKSDRRPRPRRRRWLVALSWIFLLAGLICVAIYAYVMLDARIYQAYEEYTFERARQGRASSVIGFLLDRGNVEPAFPPREEPAADQRETGRRAPAPPPRLRTSELIGRISVPRLGLAAIVREGDDNTTLRRAVGHLPGTALPGQPGNSALAGHRDTFFRGLKSIRKSDTIRVSTLDGDFNYVVDRIQIVGPKDVQVLDATSEPTLTLITCYPFHYVGHAPSRFIVQARISRVPKAERSTAAARPARRSSRHARAKSKRPPVVRAITAAAVGRRAGT